MKIAYWSPFVGAVGTIGAVIESASVVARHGHEVVIYDVAREWRPYTTELEAAGVRIVELPAIARFASKGGYLRSRAHSLYCATIGVRELRREVLRRPPDVVIPCLVAAPVVSAMRGCSRTSVVISVQGFPKFAADIPTDAIRRLENSFRAWLWTRTYTRASAVLCMTSATRNLLIRRGVIDASRGWVVRNPVVTERVRTLAQERLVDPWWSAARHPLVAVGRLTDQKNYPMMIRSIAMVAEAKDVRLAILGEGEERQSLEALIRKLGLEDRVRLYGHMKNPYNYMANASAFLLTSGWEDPGHVLVEAAALGAPIISTDCPSGPRELLANGEGGCLSPVEDAGAFAKSLDALLEGGASRDVIEIARSRASEFEPEHHYRQLIDVLNGIARLQTLRSSF